MVTCAAARHIRGDSTLSLVVEEQLLFSGLGDKGVFPLLKNISFLLRILPMALQYKNKAWCLALAAATFADF